MIRATALIALLVAASGLSGCGGSSVSNMAARNFAQLQYRPDPGFFAADGDRSGFSEERLDATTWKVSAAGTSVTLPARTGEVALLRAAEIGKQNGFTHFRIADRKDSLTCVGTGGGAYHGAPATELKVVYTKASGPDYSEIEKHLVDNRTRVGAPTVSTEEERKVIHMTLRAVCNARRS